MANSTSSVENDRHRRIQKSVLRAKHKELRDNMNFHNIYPHLNTHGLLPPTLNQVELVDELGTSQRKIDKVIAYMPDCGKPNYLDKFIICLKETNYGTGDAHLELAETIEKAYKSEMERSVSPSETDGISISTIVQTGNSGHNLLSYAPGTIKSSANLKRCICLCPPIVAVIFIAVLTIIVLGFVPSLSNVVYTPNVTVRQNVIEMNFESEAAFWVAEASISVNSCDSNVIVVQRRPCSSLPTIDRNSTRPILSILFFNAPVYFLENSDLHLSVLDNDNSNNPNASIWILNRQDYLESRNGTRIIVKQECDSMYECPRQAGQSCCYHTHEHAGGTILHQITKADFYVTVPMPFKNTFSVSYTAVVYDLDAIVHLPHANMFQGNAEISRWFHFNSAKCILLNCSNPHPISGFSPITVSNISRRFDVLILALILIVVLLPMVVVALILIYKLASLNGKRCCIRSSTTLEEVKPLAATKDSSSSSETEHKAIAMSINTFQTGVQN